MKRKPKLQDFSVGTITGRIAIATQADVNAFAQEAAESLFGSCISAIVGRGLQHRGVSVSFNLEFQGSVALGQLIKTRVEVEKINSRRDSVSMACTCRVDGKVVVKGSALVR